MARTLIFDIETSTSGFKANAGFILCAVFKELGKPVEVLQRDNMLPDPLNDRKLVKQIYERLLKADVLVGHNIKWFDMPFINSRLKKWGFPIIPPKTPFFDTCDVCYKKLRIKNSLEAVGEFLGCKTKKFVVSHDEWTRAYAGNEKSLRLIIRHCKNDVKLNEEVYLKLRDIGFKHPNIALIDSVKDACPICGKRGTLRVGGWNYAQVKRARRFFCRPNKGGCGAWSHGKYEASGVDVRL